MPEQTKICLTCGKEILLTETLFYQLKNWTVCELVKKWVGKGKEM